MEKTFKCSCPVPINWSWKGPINLLAYALVESFCGRPWALAQPMHPKHLWTQKAGFTSRGLVSKKKKKKDSVYDDSGPECLTPQPAHS